MLKWVQLTLNKLPTKLKYKKMATQSPIVKKPVSPVVTKDKSQDNSSKPQTIQPGSNRKPKSRIAALLLSVYLGSLGIDRFYMGYIGTGILKLITLGGLGIWSLIDIILIAKKHDFAKVEWLST